jgi:hypothetical protein
MVEMMTDPAEDEEDEEESDSDTDMDMDADTDNGVNGWGGVEDDDEMRLQMDAARVFEKTIVQLNERLGELDPIRMSDD